MLQRVSLDLFCDSLQVADNILFDFIELRILFRLLSNFQVTADITIKVSARRWVQYSD